MNVNEKIAAIYKGSQIIDSVIKNSKTIYSMLKTLQGIPPFNFRSIGGKVIDYKIYGNKKQQLLPSEYQQVEYIESTGTQFIDTGIKPKSNISTNIVFQRTGTSTYRDEVVLGSRENDIRFYLLGFSSGIYMAKDTFYHTDNPVAPTLNKKFNVYSKITDDKLLMELDDNKTYYNSTNTSKNYNNLNMYLFANNYNDIAQNGTMCKFYKCIIYDNDIVIRNFIPCYRKNDNKIGLYDLVSNTFFTNAGTGTFLKGNDTPTSTAPIDVLAVGDLRNLFDINNITANQYIYVDGGTGYSTKTNITNYFEVHANKKIIIEFEYNTVAASGNRSYCFYDTNKNVVSGENYNSPTKKLEITPSINGFMRIAYDINTEKVTIYEEGKKYKIPLNLKGYNTLNLPNKTITSNGVTISSSNQKISANGTINNSSWCVTEDIPLNIKAGETVFVKYNDPQTIDYQVIFRFLYESDTYDYVDKTVKSTRKEFNFVATKNITKLALFFGGDLGETLNINNATIMISTKDVPYKPYEDTNIYLDKPLYKIDDVADYIDFSEGKVHRYNSEHIFDGTETSTQFTSPNIGRYDFNLENSKARGLCVSSHFRYMYSTDYDSVVFLSSSAGDIGFVKKDITTLEGFRNWLAANRPKVAYQLQTPIEEDIELPEILTFKGENTLSVDTTVLPSNMIINYK